ncbi:hypothetical protein Y032_0193g1413 [Ancylostoma ceylanicum]|uniref:Uncharacterized protein n=1 Tax=Ancylostoma ceylanicum TaxID=53326 RepID=A0A016SPP6_9BILA|nr:hypothetical protein Y032_0193g1413 [Ancylostoma ceylanicum]
MYFFHYIEQFSPSNLHCLFVGDLLNFGTDSAAYQKEKNFIIKIGEKLFDSSQGVSAGIWAYGYTKRVSLVIKNDAMHHNFEEFSKAADAEMQLQNKKILSNERVITVLNSCNDPQRSANCLVFFSGVDDVSVWKKKSEDNQDEYQKLNMTRNAKMTRIVAVGLKSVDLSKIVIPTNGKAVKVSKSYSDDDVSEVVKAILKEPVEE